MSIEDARKPVEPLVSIGLPVYNGEDYLGEAIQSILTQTYTNFELIVADNASTDSTPAIIAEFAAKDSRIRVFTQERNIGAAPNFNFCIDQARGPYFKWLAHDDGCRPTYLEKCVAVLQDDPRVVIAHARPYCIDSDGNPSGTYHRETRFNHRSPAVRFDRNMEIRHGCISVFGVMRIDVLKKTSALKAYVGSDRALLAELALHGRIVHVPEELFIWRDHRDRSIYLGVDKLIPWFDTNSTSRFLGLHCQHPWGCAKAAMRAPVSIWTKILCLGLVVRWCWRNRDRMAADIRLLGRIAVGTTASRIREPVDAGLRRWRSPRPQRRG